MIGDNQLAVASTQLLIKPALVMRLSVEGVASPVDGREFACPNLLLNFLATGYRQPATDL